MPISVLRASLEVRTSDLIPLLTGSSKRSFCFSYLCAGGFSYLPATPPPWGWTAFANSGGSCLGPSKEDAFLGFPLTTYRRLIVRGHHSLSAVRKLPFDPAYISSSHVCLELKKKKCWISKDSKYAQNIAGSLVDGVVHLAWTMTKGFVMEMTLELGLERMGKMIQNCVSVTEQIPRLCSSSPPNKVKCSWAGGSDHPSDSHVILVRGMIFKWGASGHQPLLNHLDSQEGRRRPRCKGRSVSRPRLC